MTLSETFRSVLSPPHPAGRPFLIGALLVGVLALVLGWHWLVWLALLFFAFCLYFFRDPERVPPGRSSAVIAAADGRVVSVAAVAPPPELGMGETPVWRVATFLSVLDVHVNRLPVDGVVTRIAYRHGAYVNAAADKASELNERNALAIRMADGRQIAVVQIAGLIARRILCHIKEGDRAEAGARYGLIRFGSRTDVYLPPGVMPLVGEGQTMIGGETVIAELGEAQTYEPLIDMPMPADVAGLSGLGVG